ncbi:hypothetical protein [Macrococcus lamae]|nr:hypothetical protein [Macrococcus lamae]
MMNYIYGNTILTYAKNARTWEFAGFGYGDAYTIKEVEKAFAK